MKSGTFNKLESLTIVVEHTADNVVVTTKDGTIEYVNPAFEKTTGYKKSEVLGKNPRILRSGEHPKEYYVELWTTILSGRVFRGLTVNKNKKGELFYADHTITPIHNAQGEITHFVSVWKDATERVIHEKSLKLLNKQLAFEKYKLQEILDFDELIIKNNKLNEVMDFIVQKVCEILEVERCSLMLYDEDQKCLLVKAAVGLDDVAMLQSKIKIGEGIAGMVAKDGQPLVVKSIKTDQRIRRGNGFEYKTESFMCVPIKLDNKFIGVINITDKKGSENAFSDLDLKILLALSRRAAVSLENAQIYRELRYLTVTDPMTNLFNYRYFTKTLDYEIERSRRFHRPFCLMMIDVDNLKTYNDVYGHLEGDALLRTIGQELKLNLREIDIICRYAGDEFVVILPETDITHAKNVGMKLLKQVEEIRACRTVTISIGIAAYATLMQRHDLVLKADTALYKAKKEGKNRLEFFS